jgi:hypothetical protein
MHILVATMTEKVLNLARHFAEHRKDKHGNRGFQVSRVAGKAQVHRLALMGIFFRSLLVRAVGYLLSYYPLCTSLLI